ncbi:hypothetical protein FN846DRAFT_763135, partial [Sphaerosporella brunnea]
TTPLRTLKITNPRADPANPTQAMTIRLTPRATARLSAIQSSSSGSNPTSLRISVTSGGCHGFQYNISLSDEIDAADDTVFTDEATGARVVLDHASLELLKDSEVDYTKELIGSQFVVRNPAASSSCGCGTSFDIKF